jgi:hypothetical protein
MGWTIKQGFEIGTGELATERWDAIERACREACIEEHLGHLEDTAVTCDHLGQVMWAMGKPEAAEGSYRKAVDPAESLGIGSAKFGPFTTWPPSSGTSPGGWLKP